MNSFGITVVGDFLYVADGNGHVVRIHYDGVVDSMLGTGQDTISIATDPSNLYFTEWGRPEIHQLALDATLAVTDVITASTATPGSSAQSRFSRIVFHDGAIYWATYSPNALWRAAIGGSSVTAVKVVDKTDGPGNSDFDLDVGLAVDGTDVYYTDDNHVWRFPLASIGDASAMPVMFASDQGVGDLTVDDTRVYWTDSNGLAWAFKTSKGTFATYSGARGRSVFLDGNFVYWTVFETAPKPSQILRAPRGGDVSTVEVVANSPATAYALTADCGAIYFTTFDTSKLAGGAVYRVRKPN